jgi:hypothetical protein
LSGRDTMLGGDAWVDGIGTVVCDNKRRIRDAVLSNSKLLLHMMCVQAIGTRDQSQNACRQSVFHTEYGRRKPGSDVGSSQVCMSRGRMPIGSHRLMWPMEVLSVRRGARKDRK